jgi:hypothetical protein
VPLWVEAVSFSGRLLSWNSWSGWFVPLSGGKAICGTWNILKGNHTPSRTTEYREVCPGEKEQPAMTQVGRERMKLPSWFHLRQKSQGKNTFCLCWICSVNTYTHGLCRKDHDCLLFDHNLWTTFGTSVCYLALPVELWVSGVPR